VVHLKTLEEGEPQCYQSQQLKDIGEIQLFVALQSPITGSFYEIFIVPIRLK